jgi:hypothetical protein
VSVAAAASPREIYEDFADNGRLDQTYSETDLRRVLADASIQGYGNPTVTDDMRNEVQQQLGQDDSQDQGVDAVGEGGTLPFTGVDLALLTLGAGLLLAIGWGFRKLGRPQQ